MSFRAGTPLRIGACHKVRRCFSTNRPSKASASTRRFWDAYLPDWRKDSKNVVDVPQEIKDALKELIQKYRQATSAPKSTAVSTDDLAFAQLSKKIKPVKGDYFRIAKDVALKAHEEGAQEEYKDPRSRNCICSDAGRACSPER